MKAILKDISAMPFDRMELCMLPPGELDVEIHLRCDAEAYRKLVEFFVTAGFQKRDGHPVQAPKALPEPTPELTTTIEPKKLRKKNV